MDQDIKLIADTIAKIKEYLNDELNNSAELESAKNKLRKCAYDIDNIIIMIGLKLYDNPYRKA